MAFDQWLRSGRIPAEVRTGVMAFAGVVVAPFVVFVVPVARLYWLLTGNRLPGVWGAFSVPSAFINPFADNPPREIRALLARATESPEWKDELPAWLRAWGRFTQLLFWRVPTL